MKFNLDRFLFFCTNNEVLAKNGSKLSVGKNKYCVDDFTFLAFGQQDTVFVY